MMQKGEFVYEGKAKRIYRTETPGVFWMEFKDDATAQNGLKRGTIGDKGVVNTEVTRRVLQHLAKSGVPTHLREQVGERDLLVDGLEMLKLEVVMRNVAAGSLVKRLGIEEGRTFPQGIVELYLKDDDLGDPLINDDHALAMNLATAAELEQVKDLGRKINSLLKEYFLAADLILVDFKLEFGRRGGEIVLGDEVTPDTCRLWDRETRKKLDKDRFRQDLGGVEEAYQEVLRRLVATHA